MKKYNDILSFSSLFIWLVFRILEFVSPISTESSEGTIPLFHNVRTDFNPNDKSIFFVQWPGNLNKPLTSTQLEENNLETMVISTARKEKYQCYVPVVKSPKESQAYNEEADIHFLNPYTLIKTSIEESHYTPCSYKLDYYWTYELCHGKHIRQYHEDRSNPKSPKLQEYVLGKFDKDGLIEAEKSYNEYPKDFVLFKKRIEGKDFPFVQINMTGGTICDLTKKPRVTQVLYVCHVDGRNDLYSFEETSSCEYSVVVLSAALCKHPLFKTKTVKHHDIQCYSMDKSPKMPKLLSKIELESAKLRLSNFKPKIKFDVKEESDEQETDEKLQEDNQPTIPKKPPVTEMRKVRPPSRPPYDQKLIDDFLKGEHCLEGGTSWWRYRFCFGKKVEQFHKDVKNKHETVILLGLWNAERNEEWLKGKKIKVEQNERYLRSLYTGGDFCESINLSREVEVRLKCKKDSSHLSAVTMSLIEPSTCRYILKLESPIICTLNDQYNNAV